MVIADQIDDNLALARATWPTCWWSSALRRSAVARLLQEGVGDQGAIEQLKEMYA